MLEKEKYKCIIVEDEALAIKLMQSHILQKQELVLVQICSNVQEANDYLQNQKIDLMFLDIQLQQLSGIDFLKSLQNPPKVIFTTAYSEFALEGYELNIIDYLLKPITFDRFNKGVNKALEIINLEHVEKESQVAEASDHSIVVKSSHQHIKIVLDDILYIKGLHKYVKIVTSKKQWTTLIAISAIEQELASKSFYRCHRSFIVNLSKIESIDGNLATIDTHKIPISKLNKQELLSKLGKKIG